MSTISASLINVFPAPSYPEIDHVLAAMEKNFFNPFGYIPFLGTLTGVLREIFGVIELVSALAIGILHFLGALFEVDARNRDTLFQNGMYIMEHYGIHGFCNFFRGQVESLPGVGLICFVYDRYCPRCTYKEEDKVFEP